MSHSSKQISLLGAVQLGVIAFTLGVAGCASQHTQAPVASAPPSEAFQRASSGVAETQGDPQDMVFVEKAQKSPQNHDDAPVTDLHHDQSAHPKLQ